MRKKYGLQDTRQSYPIKKKRNEISELKQERDTAIIDAEEIIIKIILSKHM